MCEKMSGLIPPKIGKQTDPNRALAYTTFTARLTVRALEAFKKKELERFDALVRDTSCQLRAREVVDLADNYDDDPAFQREVDGVIDQARGVAEGRKSHQSLLKKSRRAPYVTHVATMKAEVDLTERVSFLVLCYMLTEAKQVDKKLREFTQPDGLRQRRLGGRALKNPDCTAIVEMAQVKLAALSIKRLREASDDPMLGEANEKTCHCGGPTRPRQVLPCFYTVKALLTEQLVKLRPIQVLVRLQREEDAESEVGRLQLFYRPEGGGFVRTEEPPKKGAMIVIEGISVRDNHEGLLAELDKQSLTKLILGSAAAHPQYAGREKSEPIPDKAAMSEMEEYAAMAMKVGCCLAKPTLFSVDHIFATAAGKKEGEP